MKGRIPVSLALAETVAKPAVETGLSMTDYVALLRQAVPQLSKKEIYKATTGINNFERWLTKTGLQGGNAVPVNEALFARWRSDMQDRKFCAEDRTKYSKSFFQSAVGIVIRLHNSLAGTNQSILRSIMSLKSLSRLTRFNDFTTKTKAAMLWYEKDGSRPAKGKDRPIVQTVATRKNAISEAFNVLDKLGVKGLEQINKKHVESFLGTADETDAEYRKRYRSLHNLKALYRACCDHGLLPCNPLTSVGNRTFSNYATQDFVPPAQLDCLLDISAIDMQDEEQVRNRLVCLSFLDFALRKNELGAIGTKHIWRDTTSYAINLPTEIQKMSDKKSAVQHPYYSQTQDLLEAYMPMRQKYHDVNALFVGKSGKAMSGDTLARVLTQECNRLGVHCYYDKTRCPSPHDMRRTFGMVNSGALGLRLDIRAVAIRLRDSVAVVEKHYVTNNPLLEGLQADEFRRRSEQGVNDIEARRSIECLEKLGVEPSLLGAVRSSVETTIATRNNVQSLDRPSGQWMDESDSTTRLHEKWGCLPSMRVFRAYLRGKGLSKRSGERGKLMVDSMWIERMAQNYIPLNEALGKKKSLDSRTKERLLTGIEDVVQIGTFVLVGKTCVFPVMQRALKLSQRPVAA